LPTFLPAIQTQPGDTNAEKPNPRGRSTLFDRGNEKIAVHRGDAEIAEGIFAQIESHSRYHKNRWSTVISTSPFVESLSIVDLLTAAEKVFHSAPLAKQAVNYPK